MAEGRVKWFNPRKGYGFIASDDGKKFFVHHTSIVGEGLMSLQDGDRVSFEQEKETRGRKAVRVRKL